MRVTIKSVKRLTNSTNGNPRWELNTSEGTFKTKTDAQCGYSISNNTSGDYDLDVNGRGTVEDIRKA